MAAPTAPDADGEALVAAELAALVRSAACGLDERDQLVLELSVRQGLQGADLAAALGVTAEQSYTVVHRMRYCVERSLGALVVACAGRKDCPELADVLKGWNGEFSVPSAGSGCPWHRALRRMRSNRRNGSPDRVRDRRSSALRSTLIMLRDRILARAGTPGIAPAPAYTFDPVSGFPRPLRSTRLPAILVHGAGDRHRRRRARCRQRATGDDGDPAAAPPPATISAPTQHCSFQRHRHGPGVHHNHDHGHHAAVHHAAVHHADGHLRDGNHGAGRHGAGHHAASTAGAGPTCRSPR